MKSISSPVIKKDHSLKAGGKALYLADLPSDGVLTGMILHSQKAKARIKSIILPSIPSGYYIIDKNDVPGVNKVAIVKDDYPVFANDTVEYIGEAILMVVGPDKSVVENILNNIEIEYEELEPVLDIDKSDTVFFEYNYGKGDIEKAFAEADRVFEETFETGYQEQIYLEVQCMQGEYDDGKITVRGSMQCPYYVHSAVANTMGLPADKVRIVQDVTGGGFGGKEAYPSILAAEVAVAAYKAKMPVRCVFSRQEDITYTSKRHPSRSHYKAAVKNGIITAIDADITFNAGAYTTLSAVVLQRALICASGVYNIPNLKVHGRAVKTNVIPSGAFRGFGAPQSFFASESFVSHIADELGIDIIGFKLKNLVKQGDDTSTGGKYHFYVPLPDMAKEILEESDYINKHKLYSQKQTGRYRRGIGMAFYFHGAGFTGSAERDMIKSVVRLNKHSDGKVEILVANTDMGQGIKTTFSKIVNNELNIGMDNIIIENPDTDRVPNSGPTVASRSLMIVGELLRRAAIHLREIWEDGKNITVEERYKEPDFMIPFSLETFSGDAYATYAWGINAVEVEVDTLTGLTSVLGAWGDFDVGTPIDEHIVAGQMEGGFVQGIGYGGMEKMTTDAKGRVMQTTMADYTIPTAMDVPNMKVILHVQEFPDGPYGAKGAGELPLAGPAPAYTNALEQALGMHINKIPFTPEDIIKSLSGTNSL